MVPETRDCQRILRDTFNSTHAVKRSQIYEGVDDCLGGDIPSSSGSADHDTL